MNRFIRQINADITSSWQITILCLVAEVMNGVLVVVTNINVSRLQSYTQAHTCACKFT